MQRYSGLKWPCVGFTLVGLAFLGLAACSGPFDDESRLSRPVPFSVDGGGFSGAGEGEESPYCPAEAPKEGETCPRDAVSMNRCPYVTDTCRINDVTYGVESTFVCSEGIWSSPQVRTRCPGKDPDEVDAAEEPRPPVTVVDAASLDATAADSRGSDTPGVDGLGMGGPD